MKYIRLRGRESALDQNKKTANIFNYFSNPMLMLQTPQKVRTRIGIYGSRIKYSKPMRKQSR